MLVFSPQMRRVIQFLLRGNKHVHTPTGKQNIPHVFFTSLVECLKKGKEAASCQAAQMQSCLNMTDGEIHAVNNMVSSHT